MRVAKSKSSLVDSKFITKSLKHTLFVGLSLSTFCSTSVFAQNADELSKTNNVAEVSVQENSNLDQGATSSNEFTESIFENPYDPKPKPNFEDKRDQNTTSSQGNSSKVTSSEQSTQSDKEEEKREPITTTATTYTIEKDTILVGNDEIYEIDRERTTTLEFVSAKYQLGLSNMIEANPGVDPIVPVPGTKLIIPKRTLLPNTVHKGIVINSPEMRLYYYHDDKVDVLPIGIGQLGTDTPLDWTTKIYRKKANPTWTPTAKMHEEYKARGEFLPKVWPAGPDNPMGLFALYIGNLYAIHGTNADFGIGLRVSHGCVRLRNEDIEYLFNTVPIGTRVQFINDPIKIAEDKDGNLFIEVHQPLSMSEEEFETLDKDLPFSFTKEQEEFFKRPEINQEILKQALEERSGRVVWLNPVTF